MKECAALVSTYTFGPSPKAQNQSKGDSRRILRIGHRGAAGHAPENTIAAIRRGISLGVDFVELDVQRTRDGRLVIMHDKLADRTTNCSGVICEMTWDEVQLLDAGHGERVPSVEAALAAATGRAGVMLEAKTPGIGPDLYNTVQASAFSGSVIYASFLHAEILRIRRIDPQARTMALMECIPPSGVAAACEANAAMVGLAFDSATAEFASALHDAGLVLFFYTVNEPSLIARAIDLGADGVISDYPERVPKDRSR
jgi:glycerophosphoryl diester phosphodiesterase